jgi:hypothetical protein
MAGLIDAGYVARPEEDVFATTGAHLDVRVLKDGKYINPETIRSLLTRLKVGKERKPLWQQQGSTWKPAAPITSGFGPRVAPTAGASTYHPAHDYGLGAGTQLAWEGPGEFTPNKGYGSIKTTDAQGTPYEIKLLHTKGGKSSAVAPVAQQATLAAPTTPAPTSAGNIYNFYLQGKKKEDTGIEDLLPNPNEFLTGYAKNLINPLSALQAAFNSGGALMT